MSVVWAILLMLIVIVCWALSIIGLPGNWLILVAAGVYAFLVPDEHHAMAWWLAVGILLVLAILGEIVEMLAAAVGVRRHGGSRRGALLSFVGAMTGALIGLFVGLPIPVVGSIVAAVLFACVGALLGAFLGEQWKGRSIDESLKVGHAAFWGRLAGTAGKMALGCVMVAVVAVALALQWLPAW